MLYIRQLIFIEERVENNGICQNGVRLKGKIKKIVCLRMIFFFELMWKKTKKTKWKAELIIFSWERYY